MSAELRAKRLIDIIGAGAALVVASPAILVVGLLVWARLGTPILFRQMRSGHHARPFTLYKFRTMRDTVDSAGRPLLDGDRLTPLGRALRRLSLDELPQLWNVLRGDMSLVGPRPLVTEYVDRYSPEQARRLEVMPGITGLAQVSGRNAIPWERRFELDVWYVDHWSLMLDVRILARTVGHVVSGKGISSGHHATSEAFADELGRSP